jgi:pyruvate carboxylase
MKLHKWHANARDCVDNYGACRQRVKTSDRLMSLEGIKMESAILSARDGLISELFVEAGDLIDAKQLLYIVAD